MIRDIGSIVWKEWRELAHGDNGKRTGLAKMFLVVALGIFLSRHLVSTGDFQRVLAIGIVFWSAICVLPIVPSAIAGEREQGTLETLLSTRVSTTAFVLGKYVSSIIYGVSLGSLTLVGTLGTLAIRSDGGTAPDFDWQLVLLTMICSMLAAGAASAAGIFLSARARTSKDAAQALSLAALAMAALPVIVVKALPSLSSTALEQFSPTYMTPRRISLAIAQAVALNCLLLVIALRYATRARLLDRD